MIYELHICNLSNIHGSAVDQVVEQLSYTGSDMLLQGHAIVYEQTLMELGLIVNF